MTLTPSTMIPLGTKAPFFSLPNPVTGITQTLDELKSPKGTVIMFICNHCPYVKHIRKSLIDTVNSYKEIAFIAINANDAQAYPDDSPENMKIIAHTHHYPFPYLYDETQAVAKAYKAACTPDIYLFDGDLKLVYRGQFDASRPGNDIPVTGNDLKTALNNLLEEKPVDTKQKPSSGCSIKWK